jgi:hypothetical protein
MNVLEASKPYDQEIQRAMDDNGKTWIILSLKTTILDDRQSATF